MKLNSNERFVLGILLKNPRASESEISKKLRITSQAVGKIQNQLLSKEIIKDQELILDYEKLGIAVHALALIKILPQAHTKFKNRELDEVLQPVNAIRSYGISETDVTHVIVYAFRDITEYDQYFRNLLKRFGGYVDIKHSFVFSSGSIIKSSSKDLFLEVLKGLERGKNV